MNNEMIAKGKKYIMGTYSQAPIVIEKGEGQTTPEKNTSTWSAASPSTAWATAIRLW
jgi:acetylornithine/succinyldiaminopimelate/putrescine aminotransferase